jgi:hypothetical protein
MRRRVTTINSILSVTLGSSNLWGYDIESRVQYDSKYVLYSLLLAIHTCVQLTMKS